VAEDNMSAGSIVGKIAGGTQCSNICANGLLTELAKIQEREKILRTRGRGWVGEKGAGAEAGKVV